MPEKSMRIEKMKVQLHLIMLISTQSENSSCYLKGSPKIHSTESRNSKKQILNY